MTVEYDFVFAESLAALSAGAANQQISKVYAEAIGSMQTGSATAAITRVFVDVIHDINANTVSGSAPILMVCT